MSKPRVLAEPILVGREKELGELQSLLNSVIEGKGKTVFVSGEAGSGKTRLTREFLNAAIKHGVAVMAGWCLSDSQAPFFPFIEAFNNYYAANNEAEQSISFQQPQLDLEVPTQIGVEEREVTSWLAGPKPATKTGKAEMLSPQVWKDQALAAVAKTIHTIAIEAPLILFIEDLHWADSASLALLHYLSTSIKDSARVLLLATYRSEELRTDVEGRPHPLAETLRKMRREELFSELKLSSLDESSISKLAESMLGACLQQEFACMLAVRSEGSPLFVVESLRLFRERGELSREGDCWRLGFGDVGIPSKIKDIILGRLASLRREERRMLEAASVVGETFNIELLASVVSKDRLQVLETLNCIAESTSLIVCEAGSFRFDHAKSRETLYEEISLPLRKGYHARIAENLENCAKGGVLTSSDLAYHYAKAGDSVKAVKFALAAGKDELAKWSNQQAAAHFRYVLQNVGAENSEEKRSALEGLGDAYAASSMYGEAIKTFDELATLEEGLVKLRAIRKATDAAYAKGDNPDLLVEYAKKAEKLQINDRLEMARIIDNRGKAWGWSGRGDATMDLADYDAALKVFEEENSVADVAEALWRSGTIRGCFLSVSREEGLCELLRSAAIFRELGDAPKEAYSIYISGCGLQSAGLLQEARQQFVVALQMAEKFHLLHLLALTNDYLSGLDKIEGKLSDATSRSHKASEYYRRMEASYWQRGLHPTLISLYARLGDMQRADEYFEKLTKLPAEVMSQFLAPLQELEAKIVYFATKARWDESYQAFEKAMDIVRNKVQAIVVEVAVRLDYAWALEKQGRIEEAKVQRDETQKILERADERFRRANVHLSVMLPRTVQVGEEFEMRLDLVNVARTAAALTKIDGAFSPEFDLVTLQSYCSLQDGSLEMKEKSVGPFEVETLKLKLKVEKAGKYDLDPEVSYMDDEGKTKTFKTSPITLTAQLVKPDYETLPGRVTTGTVELDRLLLGGVPEGYAVVLAAPSSDERQHLIERFLEAGTRTNETTLYITCEAGKTQELAKQFQAKFCMLSCPPQADLVVQDVPNLFKLKGIDNLTDIDIALTKYLRTLNTSQTGKKRACVDLISDVLLQHHAVVTRKWLSGLLTNLKSKGFTTLAVIDPQMHPLEESRAVISLFDGEIVVTEKEAAKGPEKTLRIRKLVNQKYLESELALTKEKLSS